VKAAVKEPAAVGLALPHDLAGRPPELVENVNLLVHTV
jgi:hypothetical protein